MLAYLIIIIIYLNFFWSVIIILFYKFLQLMEYFNSIYSNSNNIAKLLIAYYMNNSLLELNLKII